MEILDTAFRLSLFLFSFACFGLFILFADALLLRFEWRTALKALGFLVLSISFAIRLFNPDFSNIFFTVNLAAFFAILCAMAIDHHSKLKFLPILPAALYFFSPDVHILLFVEAALTSVVIFQLVYTTMHRDLIPLGVSFVLIALGEYFYSLQTKALLSQVALAGAFPYLFASVLLLLWLWSYLAIRFVQVIKSN